MNSEKDNAAGPKSKQTKTRFLMKNENIIREKYILSMSCASNHAAEKYEFVFHVPRGRVA